ncbi:N-glycosylase/DNA lyase [Candidatus Micrarchaeota archaeon]|nr:N-glycosylase/DNA lyase [Candidatus Micrarchaeota archaeon]
MRISQIKKAHLEKAAQIEGRLGEFEKAGGSGGREIFVELCFCVLTPQTKARAAWGAIACLLENGGIFNAGAGAISMRLKKEGVRFHRKKGEYIVAAREKFCMGEFARLAALMPKNEQGQRAARDAIVGEVKGIGKKEASHFLRNVGHGSTLAILDRHVLKNLVDVGVLQSMPKTLTPKRYDEIERRMGEFCSRIGVPMHHLDLVFWSEQTGEIFK